MRSTRRRVGVLTAVALLLLTACGSSDAATPTDIVGTVTTKNISSDRCEANKSAGEITYLTGFDFAAAAGIIDAVVADELGYFEKMCLDVKVQAGFDTSNIPLVSSGKAQVTALGSMSEIADAAAKDGNLQAIAMLGHKPVEALAVSDKSSITELAQVQGSTMGVMGTIPFSVRVMLVRAGVSLDSLKQVEAGFNPLALDQGTFASRPVYKSNEPRQLNAAGVKYRLFDPAERGVAASFGVITVNKDFAKAHPTATEDLLRAQLKGLEFAMANPKEAVDMAYKRTDPKYYLSVDGEAYRWSVESQLVKDSTPAGKTYGYIDADEVRAEIEPLVKEVKSLPELPELDTLYDARFVERVFSGNSIVWPVEG
jgi:ABC-type nitrate/sulfonate/bicarbonate transport system substrate-binding protein